MSLLKMATWERTSQHGLPIVIHIISSIWHQWQYLISHGLLIVTLMIIKWLVHCKWCGKWWHDILVWLIND
jgi:hypothetical protein